CKDQKGRAFHIVTSQGALRPLCTVPHVWKWWEPDLKTGRPFAPVFLDQGRALLALNGPPELAWRDAATGKQLQALRCPAGPLKTVASVAVSPDGKYLAVGFGRGAQLWGVAEAKPAGPFLPHRDMAAAVQFTPDGSALVTASSDGTVRVWSSP